MFVVFFRFAFQLSQPMVLRNATRTLSPKKWPKKSNEKTDMKTTSKTCYSRKSNAFTVNSHLVCPKCNVQVHISTGGHQNLDLHLTSKACNNHRKVLEVPMTLRVSPKSTSTRKIYREQQRHQSKTSDQKLG